LFVVEDCAQAQGATWKGRPVGSFGDAAAFSFCQDKIMTSLGEGGMLTTNRAELRDRSCSFRDHGRRTQTGSQSEQDQTGKYGFRWVHDTAGTNWRITEVQSAVGRVQLRKVPQWLAARRAHARMLTARLGRISALRIPMLHEGGESAWYRFYVFVRPEVLARGWNRDRILEAINAEGIPCFVGSCSEVYLELAFSDIRPVERFPIARQLGETSLAFLVHPTLTPADIEDSCSAVEKVMTAASSQ
jgi:dTDP-4-amino-4,6-dideoxygalactose transaminase